MKRNLIVFSIIIILVGSIIIGSYVNKSKCDIPNSNEIKKDDYLLMGDSHLNYKVYLEKYLIIYYLKNTLKLHLIIYISSSSHLNR